MNTGEKEEKLRISVEPVDNPRSPVAQLLILMHPLDEPLTDSPKGKEEKADADMRQISQDRISSLVNRSRKLQRLAGRIGH